jgi:hydrogenase maturation factor
MKTLNAFLFTMLVPTIIGITFFHPLVKKSELSRSPAVIEIFSTKDKVKSIVAKGY